MNTVKSLKFVNNLPHEFNLAALRARGCLHEIYKVNEKMSSNVDSQLEILTKMKNSDEITSEIYDSMNINQPKEQRAKKRRLSKLGKINVNIIKYVRDKDTSLFMNEERVRMSKAIENLQKLNHNFLNSNNSKSCLLNSIDGNSFKQNNSCTSLIKVNSSKRKLLSPIGKEKKSKFKILSDKKNNAISNKKNDEQITNNHSKISSKFLSNNYSLPKINLFPSKNNKFQSEKKIKHLLKNIDENKNEQKKEIIKSYNSISADSKNSVDDESEGEKTPKKIIPKRNSVFIDHKIKMNSSEFINEIKRRKKNSCIGIEELKINLNFLNDGKNELKKAEKEKKEEEVSKNKNCEISPNFQERYNAKQYFGSPMERIKNIYAVNLENKKIFPKIKM